MSYFDKDEYFAASDEETLVLYLQRKSDAWFNSLISTDYLDKIKRSWQAYYGFYYEGGHAITFGGETGELVNLPMNHYGNIASHILISSRSRQVKDTFHFWILQSDAGRQLFLFFLAFFCVTFFILENVFSLIYVG